MASELRLSDTSRYMHLIRPIYSMGMCSPLAIAHSDVMVIIAMYCLGLIYHGNMIDLSHACPLFLFEI